MTTTTPIKMIIGLGNPGTEYSATRHNAGAWFVEALAKQAGAVLRLQKKLQALTTQIVLNTRSCRLLIPTTFMNHCGLAVQAAMHYYQLKANTILLVHDELDLPVGSIKLKQEGGHGGHNGLRHIIAQLGTQQFTRLRIGIGHPGSKEKVTPYVKGSKITATVVEHGRGKKINIIKFRRRKQYMKRQGHRQGFTLLEVKSIDTKAAKASKSSAQAEQVKSAQTSEA